MRAYLREDGNYDLFPDTVEPTTVSATEYKAIVKKEKLEAHKAELLKELQEIEKELGELAVKPTPETIVKATPCEPAHVEEVIPPRRPW